MKRAYSGAIVAVLALFWAAAAAAQTNDAVPINKVFTRLAAAIDTLTSARDDGFTLVTMNDVIVSGKIIIPKGAKIIGHIAAVTSRGKDAAKSVLALSIDRAVIGTEEIPVEAIIAAIAAPKRSEAETSMSQANLATNQLKTSPAQNPVSAGDVTLLLADNDQGAIGFEDVSISWHLSIPPPLTIMATHAKRLRIEAGSQILLRMMPPKAAN